MTDKEFKAMLNGKKIKWSSGKDNEKLISEPEDEMVTHVPIKSLKQTEEELTDLTS